MNVTSVSNTTNTNTAGATSATAPDQMGKDAFLQLLVAQLTHQSPTNPSDGTEFVAQLAQFTQLEQLTSVNENLNVLQNTQVGMISNQAVSYIGKDVTYAGDAINHTSGEFSDVKFSLASPAKDVKIIIKDQNGNAVAELKGEGKVGLQTAHWNGLKNDGTPADSGNYTYEVEAITNDDKPVAATKFAIGRVDGISFAGGYPELLIGNARLAPADIVEVSG
jgi:flagellar basal-body rod modification protein FlgD